MRNTTAAVDVLGGYAAAHLHGSSRSRSHEDRGAGLVEYVLLVSLIALVCVMAVTYMGQATSSQYSEVGDAFQDSGP